MKHPELLRSRSKVRASIIPPREAELDVALVGLHNIAAVTWLSRAICLQLLLLRQLLERAMPLIHGQVHRPLNGPDKIHNLHRLSEIDVGA